MYAVLFLRLLLDLLVLQLCSLHLFWPRLILGPSYPTWSLSPSSTRLRVPSTFICVQTTVPQKVAQIFCLASTGMPPSSDSCALTALLLGRHLIHA
ncbi:hypothetical protein B0H11DRAFT_2043194 [Mycena galericulata]|nr:hypothetical protein B0H11DRAFT_2043194 [Mycena galericulata]